MKKVLTLVLIKALLISISVIAQPIELVELNRIAIPEEIFLGDILQIDKDKKSILITDNSLGQVVLFNGNEWKTLDPEECHPGFWFQPIQAEFGDNEEIFITNSGIWGFRFKKNGECLGAVEKGSKFFTPEKFYYGNDIIGINADFTQKKVNVWDKKGKEIETLFSVNNEFPNAEYRFEGGGIFETDNTVYFTKALEPIIYSFNRKTKELGNKKINSDFFKPISVDIPSDVNDQKLFKEVGRVIKNSSVIYNLYQLNKNSGILLFNQHVDNEEFTFGLIFSLKDLSITETLMLDIFPDFISNNEFVFIERESNGYENETIELVFKTINKN